MVNTNFRKKKSGLPIEDWTLTCFRGLRRESLKDSPQKWVRDHQRILFLGLSIQTSFEWQIALGLHPRKIRQKFHQKNSSNNSSKIRQNKLSIQTSLEWQFVLGLHPKKIYEKILFYCYIYFIVINYIVLILNLRKYIVFGTFIKIIIGSSLM